MFLFVALFAVAMVAMVVLLIRARRREVRRTKEAIGRLTDRADELSAEEFLEARKQRLTGMSQAHQEDFTGVYIIRNKTKGMYYVGQGKSVVKRLTDHLTGHGNGDVYADFKYGDVFTLSAIPLVGSGYRDLDTLERDTIAAYDAYERGYNRTRGNRA